MRQIGKTESILEDMAKALRKNEAIFVVGLKEPYDYINRLKEDFSINVIATPKYYDTVPVDLPKIIGYEFKISK